ncbi:MAG: ABC transporter permease, partial [Candidatus Zixiibacteriota bacterium]
GISDAQIKSQKGMGENIAIFWPGITSKPYKGLPRGRRIRFTEEDMKLVKMKSSLISRISPEYSRWNVAMKCGKQSSIQNVVGIWPEFGEMRNLIPEIGSRFINDLDIKDKRRVAFIGDKLKIDLFADAPAIGETVLIDGVPFTVIGVMKKKNQDSSYNGRDAQKAFIPSTTFQSMYSYRYPNDFVAQCKPQYTMKMTRNEIDQILGARYKYDPDDKEALSVWDTTEGMTFIKNFFMAFRIFLVGIGIATLITGGIGVSNIMNVVLEERTKEIGIKMALGARKSYILSQFIVETLVITAIGGTLGFLFAYGIVSVFPMLKLEDYIGVPAINVWGGGVAVVLLGIVGLTAGYFPAKRAANLQPVQALKLF